MDNIYDLIVIGGGPAGYVAAIRASQLGMNTAVFEKEHLGGTCLNVGCIPTKTLFQTAEEIKFIKESGKFGVKAQYEGIDFKAVMERKNKVVSQLVNGVGYLLKKNKIDVIKGEAKIISSNKVKDIKLSKIYECKNILIATGSENFLPPIKGIDGKNIIGSTEILNMENMPESLTVIGGGVIGCEFANIFHSFGCKVTVIEMLPKILANMDDECSEFVKNQFTKKGITVMTDTKVNSLSDNGSKKELTCDCNGDEIKISSEYVLVSTGRRPVTDNLGIEDIGLKTERGFIVVNNKMETSVKGIYAAGDVTGKSLLAHSAFEEGITAVENMNGINKEMNYKAIPGVVFVETEISSVGLTEQQAKEKGYETIVGKFHLSGNGKSLAMGEAIGFVKVVSEKKNHEILGIHIAGSSASELVTIGASIMSMEAVIEDVINTVYPHPSISEAIKEACLDAIGISLHS